VAVSAGGETRAWQQAELVGEFLHERQTLLPLLDVQEDLVRRIFERRGREVRRFLDIGSGDGAMTQLVQGFAPDARAVLVDFSEPMLARAAERLGEPDGRWQAVRADLSSPSWHERLPAGPFDAAVSSYAIHHLEPERKRALFGELFGLLEPGGIFVNMDVVTVEGPLRGLFDDEMASNAIHAEHVRGGSRSDEEVAEQFVSDDNEDRPDSAPDQLRWLREAGFAHAELHFKWAEGAVYGGTRPS
jgi:ubiquinone/menaquinone biosynthesis C-methylase UbiE